MLTGSAYPMTVLLLVITAAVIFFVPSTAQTMDENGPKIQATAPDDPLDAQLMDALRRRDDHEIKALLDQGANIEYPRANYRSTPLIDASEKGLIETVKLLVKWGAKVNPKGAFHGVTPLTQAALNGHLDVVVFLIQHGADVNANRTQHGHAGYLVSEGIGPRNPTPLGSAALESHTEVVEYLIRKGAKVNYQDGSSYTPLMWACAVSANPETVSALLSHGADVTIKTDLGDTARNMALARKATRIIALLDASKPR